MVPVGGLEPPRLAATDFESVVYTNFTTPAQQRGIIATVLSGSIALDNNRDKLAVKVILG